MDSAVTPGPAIDLAAQLPFQVGAASIDPVSRDATFDGQVERLQPQNLKVLVALAQRKGTVVTRDELVSRCWDGRFVGDDVINRSISTIRHFAQRVGGFEIETVPRAGYRLVESRAPRKRNTRLWVAGAAALGGLLILSAFVLLAGRSYRQGEPPTPTMALLPFREIGTGAATRELALATHDSLAHTLAESGFPVRLVASSIGGRPAGDLLVFGDVRHNGQSAKATVRIEDAHYRAIVYSHQFEASGDDIKLLPERVGAQVAAALSWTGPLMALDRRRPSDAATTLEALRQMTLSVEGGDALRAYEITRRIAPRAPGSAIVQLSLAFNTAFVIGQLPRDQRSEALIIARRASDRAKALAPEFGDTHVPWCLLHSPVRMAECEDRLRAGMRADPDAPFVDFFLSAHHTAVGRSGEALELAKLSLANDRYKLWKIARVLRTLEEQGYSSEAEQLFRQGNRWWPNHNALIWNRWVGILARGDFDAIERFEKGLGPDVLSQKDRTPPDLLAAIKTGNAAAARKLCAGEHAAAPLTCMIGLARLGEVDEAFAVADRIYPRLRGRTPAEEERLWLDNPDWPPLGLLSSVGAAPLRRDRRFLLLAERVGLIDYWRGGRLPDFCRRRPEPVCRALSRRAPR